MEKISIILSQIFNKTELLSCFWTEILCVFGVVLNVFMYFFLSKKRNIKRISDILTFSIFSINALFFLCVFIKNAYFSDVFNFTVLSNVFVFNNENLLFKFFINLFLTLFILCTYKITKKARFATTLMNACLLLLSVVSGLLIQVENAIISFFLLDLSSFFIYKYASNMRLKKADVFSKDFIAMSILSTVLFYGFYSLLFLANGQMQSGVIQICAASALLLKAGLFPLCNYTLNKNTKTNLPYSTLLFSFLPFLGVVSFLKFSQNAFFSNEIYYIVLSVLIIITLVFSAINAFKTKNIVRFLANCAYMNFSLYILAGLILKDIELAIKSSFVLLFALFAHYCLMYMLKRNIKTKRINLNLLKGLFVKNRLYSFLFALSLLILSSCIPSVLFLNNLEIIKGIYEFDKIGSWVSIACLFSVVLVIINALKIIQTIYSKNEVNQYFELAKRTTRNCVVPVVIFVLLILGMFL